MPCRAHLAQLRKQYPAFAAVDARVAAVTFDPPGPALTRFVRVFGLPFPVLSDPTRTAYAAFGFDRGSRQKVWSWQTAGAYLRGLAQGHLPQRPRGDVEQLGGDVVLDAAGQVVFLYRGETPADRPPISSLLEAVRGATMQEPPRVSHGSHGSDEANPRARPQNDSE